MISLSRLIKSNYVKPLEEGKKVIRLQPVFVSSTGEEVSPELTQLQANQEAEKVLTNAKLQSEALLNEANEMIQQAHQQIKELKAVWEIEKEQLKEEALAEGYQAGFNKGEMAASEQYSFILNDAKQTVELAKAEYLNQIDQAEETILRLGIKVAEKIIRAHLDETKDDFIQVVKHAIKEVKDYADINIIVHPTMYELVLSQKEELTSLFNGEKTLYIYPNEELTETGCLVESSFGRIDASIDSQLNELKVKLLELIEEE